jgi:hypothetical protein
MAHHKRRGPKSTRAGCLMCKYWKDQKLKDVFNHKKHVDKKQLKCYDDQVKEIDQGD